MAALGFQATGKETRPLALQQLSRGEIQFYRPDWVYGLVELHWSPFPGWWLRRAAAIDDAAVWARKEPLPALGPGVYQLAAEDTVIQLAVHLAINHQFGPPAGRSLMDVAMTARKRPVDWLVVADRARQWRVRTAVWIVLNLLDELIGVPGMEPAERQLRPSATRRFWLRRFISAGSALAGADLSRDRKRYLLLLALVDRPRDALRLCRRTLWPELTWLEARYQGQHGRWHHLWRLVRHGHI